MNHFLIIANRQKDTKLALTEHIKGYLEEKGAVCQIYDHYHEEDAEPIEVPQGTECILVIGGDGTILEAASRLFGQNIPLLGINLGTLGFLADVNLKEFEEAIDDLMADHYELEKRIMLKAEIYRENEDVVTYTALNDFVISRKGFSKIIGLSVKINGILIDRYHADGVIVCTPTGSTGYNLSAGGPIINPTCKNFVITPICPHSLATRSVVLAKEDVISIELDNIRLAQQEEAVVTYDGREGVLLRPGDYIKIYKAEEVTPFIKRKEVSFVTILKEKLL